ncbi:NUDIX domain-containing protein [Salinibacterium sp. ZJ454]|uniref:NUDIX domain-containing protein n=1 Tax=Salinibacterium sp. ZJ454 TaxID=2708339 RepID=UPI001422BBFC|nr:NUDIX domain-containing protein [Salinibacterium sp. ZJ454]
MVERFQVVPAAYLFLRRGDEVLLQLRRDTGYFDEYWAAGAAGHVEQYESVFDAARREATEELGISVASADLVPLTAMHRTHDGHQLIDERVDFFFECRVWGGEPVLQETKAADLRWFPLDALPTPVVPHELFVLERMLAGSVPPVVSFGF